MKRIKFGYLMLIAFIGFGMNPLAKACEEDPGKLELSVSGAEASDEENYYVVQLPKNGNVTVTIAGIGDTPCPPVCECEDKEQDPEKDGDPIYTFEKDAGDQNQDVITWEITSSTETKEYKFKLTQIEQKYKECPEGWTGGSVSEINTDESDEITIAVVEIYMQFEENFPCDGESVNVDLIVNPKKLENNLDNGDFTCQKSGGGTDFDNPSNQGSKMVLRNGNQLEWKIDNARWFSTQSNHCNVTSSYEALGTIEVKGVAIEVKTRTFVVTAACLAGAAWYTKTFDGTPNFITVYNDSTEKWETTIEKGSFVRNIISTWKVDAPDNSQYYPMIEAEEIFHADNQIANPNHVRWGTTYIAENVITAAQSGQPFVGDTQQNSKNMAESAFDSALSAEANRSLAYLKQESVKCADEKEAKEAANATHYGTMTCRYARCP